MFFLKIKDGSWFVRCLTLDLFVVKTFLVLFTTGSFCVGHFCCHSKLAFRFVRHFWCHSKLAFKFVRHLWCHSELAFSVIRHLKQALCVVKHFPPYVQFFHCQHSLMSQHKLAPETSLSAFVI